MKVLVIAPQPFFTPRGTPFSVYYRTLVMAEEGCAIDLLTYGPGEDVDIPGVRIVRIPRIRWLEPVPIGPSLQKLLLDVLLFAWTIGSLVRHRYAVVHAHEESVFWCRALKPLFGFRLIYDMHSSLPQQLENFRFTTSRLLVATFRRLELSCLRAASAVITICPDLRDYALGCGVDPARHLLIENSIFDDIRLRRTTGAGASLPDDGVPIELAGGDPLILYAGTFEAYQGVELLVRAFARIIEARPAARLLLLGGTERQVEQIRRVADLLQLGDRCLLTGRVPKAVAMRYTRLADILVSPRLHGTNTPLKIYEQLASGRPLVATRIWSHTQVLDDSVCTLVEPTAESLADGLLAVLADKGKAAERVSNSRRLYEAEYARPAYVAKIRRLLEVVS